MVSSVCGATGSSLPHETRRTAPMRSVRARVMWRFFMLWIPFFEDNAAGVPLLYDVAV